jgi:hypothetical protein
MGAGWMASASTTPEEQLEVLAPLGRSGEHRGGELSQALICGQQHPSGNGPGEQDPPATDQMVACPARPPGHEGRQGPGNAARGDLPHRPAADRHPEPECCFWFVSEPGSKITPHMVPLAEWPLSSQLNADPALWMRLATYATGSATMANGSKGNHAFRGETPRRRAAKARPSWPARPGPLGRAEPR